MKKCKNIECENIVDEKRIYCSLRCRNVYVNKYVRDYSKCSQTLKHKSRKSYVSNHCLNCNDKILFEKKRNKYCSHKCAAMQTNKGRSDSEITREKKSKSVKKWCNENLKSVRIEKICNCCGITFNHKPSINQKFCSIQCKNHFQRKHLTEYQKYCLDAKFKFNVFDFPNEFELKLVEKYGFYKAKNRGDNPGGVSRDHMYSLRDGFDNKIDSKIISHPANCRLVFQSENAKKHRKSIITLQQLIDKIQQWNEKYE